MSTHVTDTHPLIWHLTRDPHLSPSAKSAFEQADTGANQIVIPSIVLVEIIYLAEKKRIDATLINQVLNLLRTPSPNYRVAALDTDIIVALRSINRSDIPEMPDRIIAATARHLGVPLITKDPDINNSKAVSVVW